MWKYTLTLIPLLRSMGTSCAHLWNSEEQMAQNGAYFIIKLCASFFTLHTTKL